jgi:hypothetical protein
MGAFVGRSARTNWVRFSQFRVHRSCASLRTRLIGRSSVVAAGAFAPAASIDGRGRIEVPGLLGQLSVLGVTTQNS